MAVAGAIVYQYDGSFPGLMTAVFCSFRDRILPEAVIGPSSSELYLYSVQEIVTDEGYARRVEQGIRTKLGAETLQFVRNAYLTCLPNKELLILRFLHFAFGHGPGVLDMLQHPDVYPLHGAVLHLKRESHLLKGFIRFTARQGILAAEIGPKNCVLPLLVEHFRTRFACERFIIYDSTNSMALLHDPPSVEIVPAWDLELPSKDKGEERIETLWRLFYDTIAVEGRENPKLRMSLMPQRYWRFMTEFNRESSSASRSPTINLSPTR